MGRIAPSVPPREAGVRALSNRRGTKASPCSSPGQPRNRGHLGESPEAPATSAFPLVRAKRSARRPRCSSRSGRSVRDSRGLGRILEWAYASRSAARARNQAGRVDALAIFLDGTPTNGVVERRDVLLSRPDGVRTTVRKLLRPLYKSAGGVAHAPEGADSHATGAAEREGILGARRPFKRLSRTPAPVRSRIRGLIVRSWGNHRFCTGPFSAVMSSDPGLS
jgi:hypothetical protein